MMVHLELVLISVLFTAPKSVGSSHVSCSQIANLFTGLREGEGQGGGCSPFGCCSPRGCGHPRAAFRRRSIAADPEGCLLVLDLGLNIGDGVRGLHVERDRLAREGL